MEDFSTRQKWGLLLTFVQGSGKKMKQVEIARISAYLMNTETTLGEMTRLSPEDRQVKFMLERIGK